jgi:small-conductance mechanosensitive channel
MVRSFLRDGRKNYGTSSSRERHDHARCQSRNTAIDLEARFWLGDPQNGVSNVASDILRLVWRKFRENDVEIPFPQHDLHIRSGALPVEVTTVKRRAQNIA